MSYYKEETRKICYCGRCNQEIKSKNGNIVQFEQMIMTPIGDISGRIFPDNARGAYLCPRCLKDFNAFIKNEYHKKQTEKEKRT